MYIIQYTVYDEIGDGWMDGWMVHNSGMNFSALYDVQCREIHKSNNLLLSRHVVTYNVRVDLVYVMTSSHFPLTTNQWPMINTCQFS